MNAAAKKPRVPRQKKVNSYDLGECNKKKMSMSYFLLLFGWPLIVLAIALVLMSCTLSVTTIHTQGTASDVVDEDQTADPNVSPNIDIPMSGI